MPLSLAAFRIIVFSGTFDFDAVNFKFNDVLWCAHFILPPLSEAFACFTLFFNYVFEVFVFEVSQSS